MTQEQLYWKVHNDIAETNLMFLDRVNDKDDPLTEAEFTKLIKLRPELWGRFANYFSRSVSP